MKKTFKAVIHPEQFLPHLHFSNSSDFDAMWQNSKNEVFAYLAHVAYFDEDKINNFLKPTGIKKLCYFDTLGAQGYLAIWEDKATLIFRGSQLEERTKNANENILIKWLKSVIYIEPWAFLRNDVLADLFFLQKSIDGKPKVKVHRGFDAEVDKLWGEIESNIKQYAATLPIWVSGHSLGAAMATIASLRYPFEALTTLGSPRVGKKIDDAFLAKKHTRIVNGHDPVVALPPRFLLGYRHHSEELKIKDSDGKKSIIYDHGILYYSQNLAQD